MVLRPDRGSKDRNPPPSLAAEVVSARSAHRDYVVKRVEYLAFGLAEHWIVDFHRRRLSLLSRRDDAWHEQVLAGPQRIASVVLPGLATPVDDLWLDLDYYDPQTDEDDEDVGPIA